MPPLIERVGITLCITAMGAAWLAVRGPLPIIRFTTVLAEPIPWWYSISVFPILGMLAADLAVLIRLDGLALPTIELGSQILLLCILGSLRLGASIPVSGHVLVFSYFLSRRVLLGVPRNAIRYLEWAAAASTLVIVAYGKIIWWDDPFTLALGLAVGVFLGFVSWRLCRNRRGELLRAGA